MEEKSGQASLRKKLLQMRHGEREEARQAFTGWECSGSHKGPEVGNSLACLRDQEARGMN